MDMDLAMASVVIPNLPNLDDGMAQALTGLLTAIGRGRNAG